MNLDGLQDHDLRVILFLERNPVEAAHTVHDNLVSRVELVQAPCTVLYGTVYPRAVPVPL